MGRHGGGSSSGGGGSSHSSHSSGGSRSSGPSYRSSVRPFAGCYDRSYVTRKGRVVHYYTENPDDGVTYNPFGSILSIFMALFFIGISVAVILSSIHMEHKLDGSKNFICVEDTIDLLTDEEEARIIEIFEKVYEKSGMPVMLYVDDDEWKNYYNSIEVCSESLYYSLSDDEAGMLIYFSSAWSGDFWDWEYDCYCADDTIKCFSDQTFNLFLNSFQKKMAKGNLADTVEFAWNRVYNDLAKSTVDWMGVLFILPFICVGGILLFASIADIFNSKSRADYFKKHPEIISAPRMMVYPECPKCGAPNSEKKDVCEYCGTVLELPK